MNLSVIKRMFQNKEKNKVTRILFVHPGRAALPELRAYREYLAAHLNVSCDEWVFGNGFVDYSNYDVIWVFMGLAPRNLPDHLKVIHEYASLSTGCFARFKDRWKRYFSPRPNMRVFLNDWVEDGMSFQDGIPAIKRDMGVWSGFFVGPAGELASGKDWLYAGSVHSARGLDVFLRKWSGILERPILHLVGTAEPKLVTKYGAVPGIIFHGSLSREKILDVARLCGTGLNLVPNQWPYQGQTCTKVLEYVALGLRIVSSRTLWMEQFVASKKLQIFWLDSSSELADAFNTEYRNGDVSDLEWGRVLDASGIMHQLGCMTVDNNL